jgi:hypothetical protein
MLASSRPCEREGSLRTGPDVTMYEGKRISNGADRGSAVQRWRDVVTTTASRSEAYSSIITVLGILYVPVYVLHWPLHACFCF